MAMEESSMRSRMGNDRVCRPCACDHSYLHAALGDRGSLRIAILQIDVLDSPLFLSLSRSISPHSYRRVVAGFSESPSPYRDGSFPQGLHCAEIFDVETPLETCRQWPGSICPVATGGS